MEVCKSNRNDYRSLPFARRVGKFVSDSNGCSKPRARLRRRGVNVVAAAPPKTLVSVARGSRPGKCLRHSTSPRRTQSCPSRSLRSLGGSPAALRALRVRVTRGYVLRPYRLPCMPRCRTHSTAGQCTRGFAVDDGVCAGSAIGAMPAGNVPRWIEPVDAHQRVEGLGATHDGDLLHLLMVMDADDPAAPAERLSAQWRIGDAASMQSQSPRTRRASKRFSMSRRRFLSSSCSASLNRFLSSIRFTTMLATIIGINRKIQK